MTMGKVSFGGVAKEVCLAYVPEAQVGDYVIVHAGFALNTLDEEEANGGVRAAAADGRARTKDERRMPKAERLVASTFDVRQG